MSKTKLDRGKALTKGVSRHTFGANSENFARNFFKTTQTDNKPNFGAGGNRKVKVSLAKVNLPEDGEG